MAQLPHYLLNIDDSGELGIEETSFVEYPATGLSFLAFEDEKVEHTFAQLNENGYQRLVSGVLMMPSTKYLRSTREGEFYTVEFTAETLKNAMIDYLKKDNQNNVKVEHRGQNLNGFAAIEHWIIEDNTTKSPILGLSLEDLGYDPTTVPQGTIMKTTYVADEQFFTEQILTGKVQGYSIGGMFELEEVEAKTEEFRLTTDVPTVADVLRAIGISGKEVVVTSKEGNELTFGETVKEGDTKAEGTFEFGDNLKVVIKEGVIVDYGFQETNQTNTMETTNTNTEAAPVAETTEVSAPEANVETTSAPEVTETKEVTPEAPQDENLPVAPQATQEDKLAEVLAKYDAKLAEMTSKLTEVTEKLTQLGEEATAKDAKIGELKDKLKKEPIKKTNALRDLTTKSTTKSSGKTLKIGNKTVNI